MKGKIGTLFGALILAVMLAFSIGMASAQAQGQGTVELSPAYVLLGTDGEELGVGYILGHGRLILTEGNDPFYTCGCASGPELVYVEGETVTEYTEGETVTEYITEYVEVCTETPKCNNGGGNGAEGCDATDNPKANDDEGGR